MPWTKPTIEPIPIQPEPPFAPGSGYNWDNHDDCDGHHHEHSES